MSDSAFAFLPRPKVVERASTLPLINDTWAYVTTFTAPLHPTIETIGTGLNNVHVTLKAGAEEKLPTMVTASLTKAGEVAMMAGQGIDSLACSGLDRVVEAVPCLEKPMPQFVDNGKEVAQAYIGAAKDNLTGAVANSKVGQFVVTLARKVDGEMVRKSEAKEE